MTREELSRLYNLNREIEQDKQRLDELRAAATDTSAKITGLPHVGSIADKTALAAEIADTVSIIEAKQQMCVAEYNRLCRYIASIDDSLMRQIISLRFINGLSWRQVAYHVGGNNTEESVRQAFSRFMKTCHKCHKHV